MNKDMSMTSLCTGETITIIDVHVLNKYILPRGDEISITKLTIDPTYTGCLYRVGCKYQSGATLFDSFEKAFKFYEREIHALEKAYIEELQERREQSPAMFDEYEFISKHVAESIYRALHAADQSIGTTTRP